MAVDFDTQVDQLLTAVNLDILTMMNVELKAVVASFMKSELEKHKVKGHGSAYASKYGYMGLGSYQNTQIFPQVNAPDLMRYMYVDMTPPNDSIFEKSHGKGYQEQYRDAFFGNDLSEWINEGSVPDIIEMFKHKADIQAGVMSGSDFAIQSYYKAGYIDESQKEIDKNLELIINTILTKKGYKIVNKK